jgi:acetyl-CoA synthetase
MMLYSKASYRENYDRFVWRVPEFYNMAYDVCDRHADGANGTALVHETADGQLRRYSFKDIQQTANRMANLFTACGAVRGDRVMILLGQNPYAGAAHVACWKAGIVSLPTSMLFGADALVYRLNDSGAVLAITDMENAPKLLEAQQQSSALRQIFVIDGELPGTTSLEAALAKASSSFENVVTRADDPAFFNYSSGTTGQPKGVLAAHRSMLGHLPGAEMIFDFYADHRDTIWSAADWAWLAGLMDVLMPFWYAGCTVVASRMKKFDPEAAFHLLARTNASAAFLTPTTLRLMRQVIGKPSVPSPNLRVIMSGGEAVGAELSEWTGRRMKAQINEAFGQTECNLMLGNNAGLIPVRHGSIGLPMPGHVVEIINDAGEVVPRGTTGHIAVRRPNPVMFLRYWNKPEATKEKFIGDWLITGDLGHRDDDGYFWFQGRADDVISASGYRIGPGEIEDAIARHESVALAAVIGVPDKERTERIKAYVVIKAGVQANEALAAEIKAFVTERLARHEVPREIEFVESLPTTPTGKIIRRELRDREIAAEAARSANR